MKATQPDYHLTLRPMAGNYQSPEHRRLACLLKALGRRWGFKCIRIQPLPAGHAESAGEDKGAKA